MESLLEPHYGKIFSHMKTSQSVPIKVYWVEFCHNHNPISLLFELICFYNNMFLVYYILLNTVLWVLEMES